MRPTLNVQYVSIRARAFNYLFISSSLYVFIVCLHLQKFYTSHVHICKFTVLFYHSLDNDQSTVDTYSVSPLIFIVKSVYLRNPHKILKENESLFKCKT